MKERDKSFGIFFDWIDDLDHLDGADAWKVIRAIAEYHRTGTDPRELVDGSLKVIVSIMFHQIKRKETVSEIRRKAVNTRYHNQRNFVLQKSTKPYKVEQKATTVTVTSNSNCNNNTLPLQGESIIAHTPAHAHMRENTKAYGKLDNVYLTEEEHADLITRYGDRAGDLIDTLSAKLKAKGYHYDDHYAAILLWAVQDGVKPQETGNVAKSYDVNDFFIAACQKAEQDMMEVSNHE